MEMHAVCIWKLSLGAHMFYQREQMHCNIRLKHLWIKAPNTPQTLFCFPLVSTSVYMEIFLECNGLAQLQITRQKNQEIKPDLLCNADQACFIPVLTTPSSIIFAL